MSNLEIMKEVYLLINKSRSWEDISFSDGFYDATQREKDKAYEYYEIAKYKGLIELKKLIDLEDR